METPEEFVGSNHQIHMLSIKPRRNKRVRLVCGGVDATSSCSCGGGGDEMASSSSVSGEEEEDMANCLILLAQGDGRGRPTPILEEGLKIDRISTKSFNFEIPKTGFYVYECKTCNRSFPSFQALGGHRASHKKPKTITAKKPEVAQLSNVLPVENFQAHKSRKIHGCSICGLEFSSGQALGGHMRRHRASAVSSTHVMARNTDHNRNDGHVEVEIMKQRNNIILELDLNLPAAEEDLRERKFEFTGTPQTMIFSAPTLVDCHY